MNKKPILITSAVALSPVLLWFASFGFDSLGQPLSYASKLLALAGFSLYGWNVILSSRLPLLVKTYGGLLNFYKWHRITGNLAFIFLIIHPTMVVARYANASLVSAYEFLKPTIDLPKMAGTLTLFILLSGVFLSLFWKLKHEIFIKVHMIMGLFLFLGAYHALFMSGSDVKESIPLVAYGTLLFLAAGLVVIYRSIFKQSLAPTSLYEVSNVRTNGDLVRLALQPISKPMHVSPGQFVFIKPIASDLPRQSHPFTVASATGSHNLEFGIKICGDFTAMLPALRLGDKFMVEGPYGEFGQQINNYRRQVWFAGGIGITPFLSLARALKNQKVDLFYSYRSENNLFFENELSELAKLNPNLNITINNSEQNGQLNVEKIMRAYPEQEIGVWICGPPKMVTSIKQKLKQKGLNSGDIFTEEFSLS